MNKSLIVRAAFIATLLSVALVGASAALPEAFLEDLDDWECPLNACNGLDGFPVGTCEISPGTRCDLYRNPGLGSCYSNCIETGNSDLGC